MFYMGECLLLIRESLLLILVFLLLRVVVSNRKPGWGSCGAPPRGDPWKLVLVDVVAQCTKTRLGGNSGKLLVHRFILGEFVRGEFATGQVRIVS